MHRITRRDAVKTAGLLIGGATLLGVLPGCNGARDAAAPPTSKTTPSSPRLLSAEDEALLLAFADTLLPDTRASPGAAKAGCGPAMNLLVSDCYDAPAQQVVQRGVAALRAKAPQFATLPETEREALLRTLDAEAVKAGDSHWFHALRDLSLKSYFSSEVGITKALRYVREPGRYVGVSKLEPGQPAWA